MTRAVDLSEFDRLRYLAMFERDRAKRAAAVVDWSRYFVMGERGMPKRAASPVSMDAPLIDYHAELYAFSQEAELIVARAQARLDVALVEVRRTLAGRRFHLAFNSGEIVPDLRGRTDLVGPYRVPVVRNEILDDLRKVERGETVKAVIRTGLPGMRWRKLREGKSIDQV